MSYLVANVPMNKCFIRMEYLRDLQDSVGEYEECYWVTTKSIQNRALYFESYVNKYGALYGKLPISAFVWKKNVDPEKLLPLSYLQYWDCLSYDITVIEKRFLRGVECKIWMPDGNFMDGMYLFTIDNCMSHSEYLNCTFSETPDEHKSFNIIKLDNGQFAAYPNNRILWKFPSLTPENPETPKFKVSTKYFYAEEGETGFHHDSDMYYYNDDDEKKE